MRGGTLNAMQGGTLNRIVEYFDGVLKKVSAAATVVKDERKDEEKTAWAFKYEKC